jgi:alpha-amylase
MWVQGNEPLWLFLEKQANHLKEIGISAVWIPPAYKGWGGLGNNTTGTVGYDVYDHFDLGEFKNNNEFNIATPERTKYGDREQLKSAIAKLHEDEIQIQVYADIVVNHKFGGKADGTFWQAVRVEVEDRSYLRFGNGFEEGIIDVEPFTSFKFPARSTHSSFEWQVWHFDGFDSVKKIRQNGAEWEQKDELRSCTSSDKNQNQVHVTKV